MQVFSQQLVGLPVISLQTGMRLATTVGLVIDRDRLIVIALLCQGLGKNQLLLLPQDIRQLAPQGVLVDSEEALTEPDEIVRVAPLVKAGWSPIGMKAVTELGRPVGRIENYTVAPDQFLIQKLHIRRPLWQSFTGASVIVDRAQVVDTSGSQIVIRDTELPRGAVAPAADLPH